MFGFISFLAILLIVFLAIITIDWSVHITMTKDHCSKYGYASFNRFKKEFGKVDWVKMENISNGVFGSANYDTCFHANIIRFEDKGMAMRDPVSFFMCRIYVKKMTGKKLSNKNNNIWS